MAIIVGVANKLSIIHNKLSNKFEKSTTNEKAKILNEFFQALKYELYIANLQEPKNTAYSIDSAVAKKYNILISQLLQNKNKKKLANFLLYQGKGKVEYTQGQALEYGLVNLLTEIGQQTSQEIVKHTGTNKGKVFTASNFSKMSNNAVLEFGNAVLEEMKKEYQEEFVKYFRKNLQKGIADSAKTSQALVDIKTDVQVEGNYKLDISIKADNPKLNKLAIQIEKALSNSTFTLKNYKVDNAYNYDGNKTKRTLSDIGLHLAGHGESLFKQVTGAIIETRTLDTNPSKIYSDYISSIYYAGVSVIMGGGHISKPIDVINHFSHLRFIFALRGAGFVVNNKLQPPADFLIWNNPYGPEIVCQSTAQIIYDLIFKEKNNSALNNYLGKATFYHLNANKHSYIKK